MTNRERARILSAVTDPIERRTDIASALNEAEQRGAPKALAVARLEAKIELLEALDRMSPSRAVDYVEDELVRLRAELEKNR